MSEDSLEEKVRHITERKENFTAATEATRPSCGGAAFRNNQATCKWLVRLLNASTSKRCALDYAKQLSDTFYCKTLHQIKFRIRETKKCSTDSLRDLTWEY